MGKKKKQKKKPINWQELAISAVIDLIKYNTNPKPSKEYAFKIRSIFSSSRTGKAAGCFHFEGKRKER